MQIKKLVGLPSRTGRHLQRRNNGSRQVVGCIPYRVRDTEKSQLIDDITVDDLEILLISSQKSTRLMFPNGGWELDEDIELAASRETLEEAGVVGQLVTKLGEWIFKSKSQEKYHEGSMFPCTSPRCWMFGRKKTLANEFGDHLCKQVIIFTFKLRIQSKIQNKCEYMPCLVVLLCNCVVSCL